MAVLTDSQPSSDIVAIHTSNSRSFNGEFEFLIITFPGAIRCRLRHAPLPRLRLHPVPHSLPKMKSSLHQADDEGTLTSALYADVVFRSSDGVLFRIRTKNLEFASDGLPPPGFSPEKQVVDLSENEETLELMFQFVYPRLQPSLEGVDVKTLLALAEAVEKYQVFAGKQLCNVYMAKTLPSNAVAVLDYSIRHNYPALANRAAPSVTLPGLAHSAAIEAVSAELLRAWVPYHNQWAGVISAITTCSIAIKTTHAPYDQCSTWLVYQKHILHTFARDAGKIDNELIVSQISVPHGAAYCCQNEAINWRKEAARLIAGISPFASSTADEA
ncbi:hypothetical protein FPV67DRAFT_967428 [Lyophyllum atratum]|nr:hypothetical protein FPV67DRAFT_967428 [Lyophyllum atratum]